MCYSATGEDPIQRKRPRKPSKDGGAANRDRAPTRSGSAGPSNRGGQQAQAQPPVAAQPSGAAMQSTDAAQRPTRLAVLEAKIMEDAAVEEVLGCIGRILPLDVSLFLEKLCSWTSPLHATKEILQAQGC